MERREDIWSFVVQILKVSIAIVTIPIAVVVVVTRYCVPPPQLLPIPGTGPKQKSERRCTDRIQKTKKSDRALNKSRISSAKKRMETSQERIKEIFGVKTNCSSSDCSSSETDNKSLNYSKLFMLKTNNRAYKHNKTATEFFDLRNKSRVKKVYPVVLVKDPGHKSDCDTSSTEVGTTTTYPGVSTEVTTVCPTMQSYLECVILPENWYKQIKNCSLDAYGGCYKICPDADSKGMCRMISSLTDEDGLKGTDFDNVYYICPCHRSEGKSAKNSLLPSASQEKDVNEMPTSYDIERQRQSTLIRAQGAVFGPFYSPDFLAEQIERVKRDRDRGVQDASTSFIPTTNRASNKTRIRNWKHYALPHP